MSVKGEAIINPANNDAIQTYCTIKCIDEIKGVAQLVVEKNHNLQENDLIDITTYDEKRGLLLYEGTVIAITACKAVIGRLRLIDEKQRRHDIRIEISIPLLLIGLQSGGRTIKTDGVVTLETVDLSAGGVLLKTRFYVAEDDACLVFNFTLLKKTIVFKAQIFRRQSENGYYLYGCKFLNNEKDKADLRRFIFVKQIENKKVHHSDIKKS